MQIPHKLLRPISRLLYSSVVTLNLPSVMSLFENIQNYFTYVALQGFLDGMELYECKFCLQVFDLEPLE